MVVAFSHTSVRLGGHTCVDDLDLDVPRGAVLGIVGPNGSGKTTALRCLYRALNPDAGGVFVDGCDVRDQTLLETARAVAALPQAESLDLDFTVTEVVATGRYPHGYRGGRLTGDHRGHVETALSQTGLTAMRGRSVTTLSGGERQRTLIARALAQDPRVLVLDEPTNHLDLPHQLALLGHLRHSGRTVLAALHDLNLALLACTHLAVLHNGRLVAYGDPSDVLADNSLIKSVFGVDAQLVGEGDHQHLSYRLPEPPVSADSSATSAHPKENL